MREPWSYDRHLVILHRYDGKTPLADLQLSTAMFWVQIHNLLFSMLSLESAMDIGDGLGEVRRLKNTSEMVGGNFLRVRVAIDISQPLCRGRIISLEGSCEHWISFKMVTGISLEMEKGGGCSDQELGEVSQKQKIREIDKELTKDGGGSNLNILKSDTINLEPPLEVNCDANSKIVRDREVVDKMDKLHAIHVSNPMNCGAMENLENLIVVLVWIKEVNTVDWLCEDQAVAITILWVPWTNRNDVQHGGLRKNGKQLILWYTHYLEEYWVTVEVPMKLSQVYVSKWEPPTFPFYKVNVDGAVFKEQKEVGVGVVIRDHIGNIILGLSKKFQYPLGAIEVEAKAFESSLEFAKDMGIQDFVLEGDSLNIVHALSENSHAASTIPALIHGMQVTSFEFRNVLSSHVRRNSTVPTHQLAKHALGIFDFSVWIEENPCFLVQALLHDVSTTFNY
ncbi:hypothetical protein SO802_034382 [Lithocarpus litseifolius]|uniref:RNase H type-1 domain-containing protein n=1 Tax=Lithocarpus litseifolius TaxID=425828 RepID=A0AAW2BI16_9ROSI